MAQERRPSMADVAAIAGVSAQTVSRVVNGSPRVDPATRSRVEAALTSSGYRVHRAARALRTGRTGVIGAVVSTLATVGNSLLLEAVVDEASARGFAVSVVRIREGGPAEALRRMQDQGVDGVVVVNEASALLETLEVSSELRLVTVDAPSDARFPGVGIDHCIAARAATIHLLDLGHATVWHLAGPAGSFAAAERERGWREALESVGVDAPAATRGDWSSASGFEVARTILAEAAAPTALFVANDQMALGVLRAAAELGIRVPEDLSVVGFDDVDDAANFTPALTTVRQDFAELGRRAVDAALGDGVASVIRRLEAPLIVRSSTSSPRGA